MIVKENSELQRPIFFMIESAKSWYRYKLPLADPGVSITRGANFKIFSEPEICFPIRGAPRVSLYTVNITG